MGEKEASELDNVFSRGMDPDVLDPSHCHGHPAVPLNWPSREALINYVTRTRMMILKETAKGKVTTRILSIVIEHERMHQETLVYMITQDRKMSFEERPVGIGKLPPLISQNGLISMISMDHNLEPEVIIEAGEVDLGVNSWDLTTFVWDNEAPVIHTKVSEPFLVAAKPVSIKDFLCFITQGGYTNQNLWRKEDFAYFSENGFSCPATWSLVENEYFVHGFDSSKHWTEVAEEPVYVSLAEAEAFCRWMNCRVMKEEEYQRILDCDKSGEVVGLRGGGWEWTSTLFYSFPGFQEMAEYREYSTDFFDGKHYVLKGYSDATHKSMRRDSFRNFYQRQYRYVFAKFRCCRSVLS